MKYEWILDVLADLKVFAHANGLDALAGQLEQTRKVAALDILAMPGMGGAAARGDEEAKSTHTGDPGARAHG
ncbi:hypothetical protein [Shimia sp.]|uniref:hypothetical protein n=1 Tax=Shimia sp. TaxID=1954381 RepID=UPI003568773A